jgi:hypothetical protein
MPKTSKLGNKAQIPEAIFFWNFLFYLVKLNPIKKIENPDPLKGVFKNTAEKRLRMRKGVTSLCVFTARFRAQK